jgi:hypothetical protein
LSSALATVVAQLLPGCTDESELPVDERDPILADPNFEALREIDQMKRRIEKVRVQ